MDKLNALMKNNENVVKFLYVLGYLTSGYVTWLLLSSHSLDWKSKGVWTTMTIVMECGKALCLVYGVSKRSKAYIAMGVFLTIVSIICSMGFMVVENNAIENKTMTTEHLYTQSEETKANLKQQIADKKADKVKAEADKNNATASLQAEKSDVSKKTDKYNADINNLQNKINQKNIELTAAIKKNYAKTPGTLKTEIDNLQKTMDKTISARDKLAVQATTAGTASYVDKIDSEITDLENKLNGINSTPPQKATAGFFALFQMLGKLVWLLPETMQVMFYFSVTTGFEILISMLYLMSNGMELPSMRDIKDTIKQSTGKTIGYSTAKDDNVISSKLDNINTVENIVDNTVPMVFDTEIETKPRRKMGFDMTAVEPSKPIQQAESVKDEIIQVEQINTVEAPVITSQIPELQKTPLTGINLVVILTYLDIMYDTQKDGMSVGYKTMAKRVSATVKCTATEAQKIMGLLGANGILNVSPVGSRIIKTKEEAIKLLGM